MTDLFRYIHEQVMDPSRFPAVLGALVLTAVVGMVTGPAHGNANPWLWQAADMLFGSVGGRLDRRGRPAADLLFRGFFMTAIAAALFWGAGIAAQRFVVDGMPFREAGETVLLALAMSSGSVWFAVLRLYFAMRDGTGGKAGDKKVSPGAYYAIARSTRADLSVSDDYGITRAGMGLAARSFDKGLVAPALWYLIAGLPGAFLYAGMAAMAWRFGKEGFTKGFGRVPLALEKLMGAVPMLLSGVLIALAGLFTPTGGMTRALIGLAAGRGRAKYEEGGLPLTAMAYALNVSLGGPSPDLGGDVVKRGWTGPPDATARLEKGHLRRALYINLMAHLLFVLSVLGAMLWAGFR